MWSIRAKLIVGLMAAVAGVAALAGTVLVLVVQHRITGDFDVAMEAKARAMAGMVRHDKAGHIEVDFDEDMMGEFAAKKHAEYFEVFDATGKVVERSPSLAETDLPKPFGDSAQAITLPDGKEGREVAKSFKTDSTTDEDGEGTGPIVTLVLAQRTKSIERTMELVGWGLAIAAGVMAAGAAAAVWVLVNRGLRPLAGVAEQAARIDAATLSARFGEDVPPELRPIVTRLNELLGRLEGAFARERRFTAAAAHELRTPIAELRAMAEVAIRWPGTASAQGMHDVLAVAKNMEASAASLLALSRCESGQEPPRREPVDLVAIVSRAWDGVARRAAERGVTFHRATLGNVVTHADPDMVEAIARNLLENAVEYSPVGGTVTCSIGDDKLVVQNQQTGLEPADLPNLFEPFWRKDKARTGGVHAGLGLSLVKAYATAMDADIAAHLEGQGLFQIQVTFHEG